MPVELPAGLRQGETWRLSPGFLAVSLLVHAVALAAVLNWQPERPPEPEAAAAVPLIFAPPLPPLSAPAGMPAAPAPVAEPAAPPAPTLAAAPELSALRTLPAPVTRPRPGVHQAPHPTTVRPITPQATQGIEGEPVAPGQVAAPAAPSAVAAAAAGLLVPPRPVAGMAENQPPDYPAAAQRRGEQGRVMLRVAVSAAGAPVRVEVALSSGVTRLDEAAVAAVRGWRFVPASRGGVAVAAGAEVPVQFTLQR